MTVNQPRRQARAHDRRLQGERRRGQAPRRAGPPVVGARRGQRARDRPRPVAHQRLRPAALLGPRHRRAVRHRRAARDARRRCATPCSSRPTPRATSRCCASSSELGFDEIYLHHVGREQERFIDAFGERVLPELGCLTRAPRPHERPVVEERDHLLRRRRDVPRLGRRRGRRLPRADPPDRLPRRPRRHVPVAHALLSVAEPRRRLRRHGLLRGRPAARQPRSSSSSSCAPRTTAASR